MQLPMQIAKKSARSCIAVKKNESVGEEFGISQSAISQQLKVLRENGFACVDIDGNRRLYSLDTSGFEQMDEWLTPFRRYWAPKFESLAKEVARGKRAKKKQ